ncbi:hypothetical protein HOC13_03795 [Candidatus Woesearchaeota archaeon]|nr:hypothetical protein [Candidatus Woesearchaeota archaeon]
MEDLGMEIRYFGDCLVQTMPKYSQFQFDLAFGTVWRTCGEDNLEVLLGSVTSQNNTSLMKNINVINTLWKGGRMSSPDKLIYLLNMELPVYKRNKGIGSAVLSEVLRNSKKQGFEYLLCNPVTTEGLDLVKRNKFENIYGAYWGISLK